MANHQSNQQSNQHSNQHSNQGVNQHYEETDFVILNQDSSQIFTICFTILCSIISSYI